MTTAQIAENVRETVSPRGAIVLSEELPHVPSVALGIWLRTGSRHEEEGEAGLTHFLEHMCFKGTARRDAKRIVEEIEAVGGQLDAATSREHTSFYARVLEEDLPLACDVLCDILLHSLHREEDVARERDVVLDEIRMYEDDPGDVAQERLMRALYGDHPLGRPVLGRPAVIRSLDRKAVTGYRARRYAADRLVVAAAGRVVHEDLVARLAPLLSGLPPAAEPRPVAPPPPRTRSEAAGREQEQTHVALGAHALRADHPDRFTLWVLNNVLGGGASSRLFQEVRERRGLAYSIASGVEMFDDGGLVIIHTSCDPAKADQAAGVIGEILQDLAGGGVTDQEALRARDQLKGNLLLGMEGTVSRMMRLAGARMTLGRVPPLDEVQRKVEAVTPDAVRALARSLLPPGRF
ncbi:MAG: pitrilysin family protein, partial [bacterium]